MRATWGFLVLGLFVRLVRFFVVYPIWPDEAFVAANLLDRGYLDLVRPLDYVQVCPFLFLWIELTVVRLRFFGVVASSIPRVVRPGEHGAFSTPGDATVTGFPCSWQLGFSRRRFRRSATVPRSSRTHDLFAALILLAIAVEWRRSPEHIIAGGPSPPSFHFTGTVVPIGFCGDRPEYHTGAGRFSTAPPIGTMGLPDLQPDAARVVSGDLSRLDVQPECRGASGLPLGLLAGDSSALGTTWKLVNWLISAHTGNMLAYPIGGANGARPPSPR